MDITLLKSEITYKYVRSSGSGGQHVNKVSSKAELYFDLSNSSGFNDEEKQKLYEFFNNRLTKDGILIISVFMDGSTLILKSISFEKRIFSIFI